MNGDVGFKREELSGKVWKLGLSLMAANVIVFINKTYVKLFSEKI
jgi:hypothetical protein